MKSVIIDYGLGNLRSIEKALEYIGIDVIISKDPSDIDKSELLILPGVGAFRDAIMNFETFEKVVKDAVNDGKTLLGICLGMQMLTSESEEGGSYKGLGLIPGKVIRFPKSELKVPHMGWNSIDIKKNIPLLSGIKNHSYFYFVHSYHVTTTSEYEAATCNYGVDFSAVIVNEAKNVIGTQFHPEKSGNMGLKILKNLLNFC